MRQVPCPSGYSCVVILDIGCAPSSVNRALVAKWQFDQHNYVMFLFEIILVDLISLS